MQVEQEGRGAVRGERLERGAQPAQDAPLVRRAVEVDAWLGVTARVRGVSVRLGVRVRVRVRAGLRVRPSQ